MVNYRFDGPGTLAFNVRETAQDHVIQAFEEMIPETKLRLVLVDFYLKYLHH